MRQQQNNKNRMRGRGRKPQNSANRNYESNGPDVKIRGNAPHIAEKYTTLARDALSAGDRVIAENYLQHAEHYNRIVLANNAAREEAQAARDENQRQSGGPNANRDDGDQPDVNADAQAEDTTDGAGESNERSARRPRRRDAKGDDRGDDRGEGNGSSRKSNVSDDNERADNAGSTQSDERVAKNGDGPGEEPKPKPRRRTSRKKEDLPENISPDAAGLPEGLLGSVGSREPAGAED